MKLVLIWIQWSGKWTQWRILQEKYNFKLYETGTALREIATQDTNLWRLVKTTIDAWNQVSPEIVEGVLNSVVSDNSDQNLILDGFVRNMWNKESMDKIVGDYRVLYFNLPEDVAKSRLLGRMYDKKTWETFPAGATINPETWDTLTQRADDEESAIQNRIDLFYEITMPIVDIYRDEWKLLEVDALWTIDEVSSRIISKLWL